MTTSFAVFFGFWAALFGFVALASGAGLSGLLVALLAALMAAVWHDSFKDVEVYITAVVVLVLAGVMMARAF